VDWMRWHASWMSVAVDRLRSDMETTAVAISGSRCAHGHARPDGGCAAIVSRSVPR
jgi:hypothetical protein